MGEITDNVPLAKSDKLEVKPNLLPDWVSDVGVPRHNKGGGPVDHMVMPLLDPQPFSKTLLTRQTQPSFAPGTADVQSQNEQRTVFPLTNSLSFSPTPLIWDAPKSLELVSPFDRTGVESAAQSAGGQSWVPKSQSLAERFATEFNFERSPLPYAFSGIGLPQQTEQPTETTAGVSAKSKLEEIGSKILSSGERTTEDKLKTIEKLHNAGINEIKLQDRDGSRTYRIEAQQIDDKRSYLHLFAPDDHGVDRVVLRGIANGHGYERERSADGRAVSFEGTEWSKRMAGRSMLAGKSSSEQSNDERAESSNRIVDANTNQSHGKPETSLVRVNEPVRRAQSKNVNPEVDSDPTQTEVGRSNQAKSAIHRSKLQPVADRLKSAQTGPDRLRHGQPGSEHINPRQAGDHRSDSAQPDVDRASANVPEYSELKLNHNAGGHSDTPDAVVHVAANFDPNKPIHLVVFNHGWDYTAKGWDHRSGFGKSMEKAEPNTVLISPEWQLNPGQRHSQQGDFAKSGMFHGMLQEIFDKTPGLRGKNVDRDVDRIDIISHSAGYVPTETETAAHNGLSNKIRSITFLDAHYSAGSGLNWIRSNIKDIAEGKKWFNDIYTEGRTAINSQQTAQYSRKLLAAAGLPSTAMGRSLVFAHTPYSHYDLPKHLADVLASFREKEN